MKLKSLPTLVFVAISLQLVRSDNTKEELLTKMKQWPKDPLYITDMDVQNLYDQWEDSDEEKLPPDELEYHKRPAVMIPKHLVDNPENQTPEQMMKLAKKGKVVMSFVTVNGNPSEALTEELTQRWQMGLNNNHMKCERFIVGSDRAVFVFQDGSLAYDAIEYFRDQPEVKEYSIDNHVWHGKHGKAEEGGKKEEKNQESEDRAKVETEKHRSVNSEL